MFIGIDHLEILPSNVERTVAFYRDVLGFRLASRHPVNSPQLTEVIYLKLGETMVEVLAARTPVTGALSPSQVGYRTLALAVDDMKQAIEYLAGKGVAVAWGPVDLGASIRAEIRDPDALPIELRQWKSRP